MLRGRDQEKSRKGIESWTRVRLESRPLLISGRSVFVVAWLGEEYDLILNRCDPCLKERRDGKMWCGVAEEERREEGGERNNREDGGKGRG